MRDLSDRITALSPEQRTLLEALLKKKGINIGKLEQVQDAETIPKRRQLNYCPLSYDQERLWVIDQMDPGNPSYNIYSALRLCGPINIELMEKAINEVVRRHEVLRTTFTVSGSLPVMVIYPVLNLSLPVEDLRELP